MKLIIGLGNPGVSYALNRHNVGFMTIDALAQAFSLHEFVSKSHAWIASGRIGAQAVMLVKPNTFMNLSGQAVQPLMAFYKVQPSDVWVLHDELELPVGKVRIKTDGGHGGHNGLRDIDARIGSAYHRVRIGIGRPALKSQVTSYVLGNFTDAERAVQDVVIQAICEKMPDVLSHRGDTVMNHVARCVQALQPKAERATTAPEPVQKPE